jgi:hypothetical protein
MKNPFADLTQQAIFCMFLASIGAVLFVRPSHIPSSGYTNIKGFDNGWWGTILGSPKFLHDYGSCEMVAGAEVCNLSTSQLSAGSSVQSAGISKSLNRLARGPYL